MIAPMEEYMAKFNSDFKRINCKIVIYGPESSGKSSNLKQIQRALSPKGCGQMNDTGSAQFAEYMWARLGKVSNNDIILDMYTACGSNSPELFEGADGVIFVADSDPKRIDDNKKALAEMDKIFKRYNLYEANIPVVMQYNKRDLPDAMNTSALAEALGSSGLLAVESVANQGIGVFDSLKTLGRLVLNRIK